MNIFSCDWQYAWGGPIGDCSFKQYPEDFKVIENLPFEPEGKGEHLYVLIEKINENTDWVAGVLAKYVGIKRKLVSYAGRKDRHGISRQWFCLSLPGRKDPVWSGFESNSIKIIRQARHVRKLRTGALKSNQFEITLRAIDAKQEQVEQRLRTITTKGVPNYFGHQRFGYNNCNIEKAEALFKGSLRLPRNKRSLYLSAARSWLFNQVLTYRVEQGNWLSSLPGDIWGFHDNNTLIFNELESAVRQRVLDGELSPTGPLWGSGELKSQSECLRIEDTECRQYNVLCTGLETAGMSQERRILRLYPNNMKWTWKDNTTLILSFQLFKGCFATSILRELLSCNDRSEKTSNATV